VRWTEVDPISRRVELDGQRIVLSKKEFALLRALAEEPTRVYTREELLMGVWGFRAVGSARKLCIHVSQATAVTRQAAARRNQRGALSQRCCDTSARNVGRTLT
jgi:DNA-binding response OmpR family regulator